ncbi:hypothetical protein COO60DRAFT_164720 [Scenedesmus sp. NREL 46B-D3]|nr:hypothetical protein COO60DRAFT_164720 [Scenedesmus sp. NREL 46B-D3]
MPEARSRRTRAPRPLKWLGKGIGSTAKGMWRVVRRGKRRNAPMASISAAMLEHCSPSDDLSDWSSFRQDFEPLQLQLPGLPSLQQLQQLPAWLAGFLQAPADKAAAGTVSSTSPAGAVRTATEPPAAYSSSSSSSSSSSGKAPFPPLLRPQQQQQHGDAALLVTSSSSGVQLLGEMLNLKSTFPMLLHTVSGSTANSATSSSSSTAESSPAAVPAAGCSSSSSSSSGSGMFGRPQQLLTVGSRNWGNWWDGRGLLRVKIYDFAIYVDGEQAERFVPTVFSSSSSSSSSGSGGATPSLLNSATAVTGEQQQQPRGMLQRLQQLRSQHQHRDGAGSGPAAAPHAAASSSSSSSSSSSGGAQVDQLPDLLTSRRSAVAMSLILRAARDVPLQLLSEEYEKVLKRRLARAGGSASDAAALQQLLASFTDQHRLPPAVRAGSSSSGSAGAGVSELEAAAPAGGGASGGSVAKGAMLVFERSGDGAVTARVGPHVLGAVHSPKLAEALFDLYLGDQPVSKSAKDAAAQTLSRIAAGAGSSGGGGAHDPYYLPQSKSEEIKCEGHSAAGSGRKGSATKGGLGLGLSDLAACVLHMG